MKALCWHGANDVRVDNVPDPKIINPRDAIVEITSTAICGSDLHLYNGFIPTMQSGDIMGHEFMGEVVELGSQVKNLKKGDRVVIPFTISCGSCFFCNQDLWSLCDNSNPNAALAEKIYGHSPAGLFGYSHLTGGYAGGQAEYVRVPFADVGPLKIPDGLSDEQVLFLTDIFPTGYMAAENCNIQPGDTVGIWGCGPVGQFAIRSAFMLGADRVIAIDRIPERLQMAAAAGAEIINYEDAGLTPVSTRWEWKPTVPVSMLCMTKLSKLCAWRAIGLRPCDKSSSPVAKAAQCQFPAFTAVLLTKCPWAQLSTKA
jgi:threonine dehydrogenase-like Zn-dependent dehydrogenase